MDKVISQLNLTLEMIIQGQGIDKVFCAARNDEFVRPRRRKHYGITYHIAPQSARSADD